MCGKVSEGHLQAGTHVQEVKSWRSATSFMEEYVGKPETFPEGVETGRVWGYGTRRCPLFSGRR